MKLASWDPAYPDVPPIVVDYDHAATSIKLGLTSSPAEIMAGAAAGKGNGKLWAYELADKQMCEATLTAAAINPPKGPWGFTGWPALTAAIINDEWGVHNLCTLTACRMPLHPGPCKGWKHTLHEVSPGAYHALEKSRVEKLNAKRIAKIEDLKSKGLPIPKSLLKPITYDAGKLKPPPAGAAHPATKLEDHPEHLAKSGMHTLKVKAPPAKDIGKSAELVGGDAHHASEKVSKDAGVEVKHPPNPHPVGHTTAGTNGTEHHEPGKTTLGEASKKLSQEHGEKTAAEHYESKSKESTDQKVKALSETLKAEKAEKAEAAKTGTGTHGTEHHTPAAEGVKAKVVGYLEDAKKAKAAGDYEEAGKHLDKVIALAPNPAAKKALEDLKGKWTKPPSEQPHIPAPKAAKPPGPTLHTPVEHKNTGPAPDLSTTPQEKTNEAAKKISDQNKVVAGHFKDFMAAKKAGNHEEAASQLGKAIEAAKGSPGEASLKAMKAKLDQEKTKLAEASKAVSAPAQPTTMYGELKAYTDAVKVGDDSAAHAVAAKIATSPLFTEAQKGTFKSLYSGDMQAGHLGHTESMQGAHDMAHSKEWWAKKQLPAYEKLSPEEFQGLAPATQDKIVSDLVSAHGKFKDPAKVKATEAALTKFGHADKIPGATPAAAAKAAPDDAVSVPSTGGNVGVPKNLTDADLHVIGDTHRQAIASEATGALLHGANTSQKLKNLEKATGFNSVKQQIAHLSLIGSSLASELAVLHHAKGTPGEATAKAHVAATLKAYNQQRDHVQQLADAVRLQAGLGKRKIPQFDHANVQKTAAGLAQSMTTSANGTHAFTGPAGLAQSKTFLKDKLPAGFAVAHLSATDKDEIKAGKLAEAAKTAEAVNQTSGIGFIPVVDQKNIMEAFKVQPKGAQLASPTEDAYDNAVAVAAAYGSKLGMNLSVLQVAQAVDSHHSKDLGVTNANLLEKKLKAWLATPAGATYAAAHQTPDPDLLKKAGKVDVDLPKGAVLQADGKVQKLAGPGKYNPKKTHTDFKPKEPDEIAESWKGVLDQEPWTQEQFDALRAYTSASGPFNKYLRGEEKTASVGARQAVIDAQAGMRPLPYDVKLHRGTGWTNFPDGFRSPEGVRQLMEDGKTFEDKGFTSTSVVEYGTMGGQVRMIIQAPKGTPGAWLNSTGYGKYGIPDHQKMSHFPGENEVLLAAGTRYRVVGVQEQNGTTVVTVRVVGGK